MAPICDEGFGRSMKSVRPPRAQSESGIGGISHSLEAAPEDLPRGNPKAITPRVIPADVHEPDETAIRAICNRKCASHPAAIDAIVVLFAGGLSPSFPVRRRVTTSYGNRPDDSNTNGLRRELAQSSSP
jgi:hypothetical protein